MKTIGSHLASFLAARTSMRRELAPFVRFMLLLSVVVLAYAALFHVIMVREGQQHSWFTGVYWTLTVMTTLGFGDITFQSDLGRLFSVVVLVSGVFMLLIVMPFVFVRAVYEPWVEQRNRARMKAIRALPDDVTGHVLIAANDPIAFALVRRLELASVPAWIIEPDEEIALKLRDAGLPVIAGDMEDVDTYVAARVEQARLVFANSRDQENSNIILTVRERNPTVPIVALAESEDSIDVLELSGASHVLPLTQQLGAHLANRVNAGVTHANVIGHFRELQLAEFPVAASPFEGKAIRELALREELGLTVVGVWRQGRLSPARPDFVLTPQCVLVVIGTAAQIDELNEVLVIYNANPHPVIVLGGGKVGRAAAAALRARGVGVHMVEKNAALVPRGEGLVDRLIVGDAADRDVLEEAGIANAPSILLTTHDDAMNIYLTVYCRRLNPQARILTRVTHERNIEAIQRAGADFVLSYASLGVHSVLAIVQQRELVVLGEGVDLFHVPVPKLLAGKTLAEADIGARTGLNVIAIQGAEDACTLPSPDTRMAAGATLIAVGGAEDRERFREVYG
jgi:Trk K+ transport system NAD-binding subunit